MLNWKIQPEKFIFGLHIPHHQFIVDAFKMLVIIRVQLGTFYHFFFFSADLFNALALMLTNYATIIETEMFAKKCRRVLTCEQEKNIYGFGETICCPVFPLLTCNTFFCTSFISFGFLTLSASFQFTTLWAWKLHLSP